jgi:phosphate transport system substrate-binding protein
VVTTISAQPLTAAATDRTANPGTTFEIALAASTSDLLDQVANGNVIGVTLFLPGESTLWGTPLGEEPLAVIVNPANPANDLTLTQTQDIFAGRATGWSVAVREDGDDSRLAFESLTKTKPALTSLIAPSPEAMLKFVAETPDGVGYLPLSWVTESVKAVTIDGLPPTDAGYELKALIVAVAKEEPRGAAREWLGRLQR